MNLPRNESPKNTIDALDEARTPFCQVVSPTANVAKMNKVMNAVVPNEIPRMESSSETPSRSALSLQLEQFDRGTSMSRLNTSNNSSSFKHDPNPPMKSSVCNERMFLQKLSKMISEERWLEIDAFLQSPAEVASFQSGCKLSRSPPLWQKTSNDAIGSLKNVPTGMANMGGSGLDPLQIVHYACRFNPPRTIVRHLASLYPEGLLLHDNLGRLPLHYAAKWGCSYKLIDYLIEKDRSAARVKDCLGKTPLHLLCENYSSFVDSNPRNGLSSEDNMSEATKALIKVAPDAINIEDNEDTTAIEYAIASDCPLDVVRLIQKASERDWKERKKSSVSGETHTKIEEKLIKEHHLKQKEEEMSRELKRMNSASRVQFKNVLPTQKPKIRSKYAMSA